MSAENNTAKNMTTGLYKSILVVLIVPFFLWSCIIAYFMNLDFVFGTFYDTYADIFPEFTRALPHNIPLLIVYAVGLPVMITAGLRYLRVVCSISRLSTPSNNLSGMFIAACYITAILLLAEAAAFPLLFILKNFLYYSVVFISVAALSVYISVSLMVRGVGVRMERSPATTPKG